MAILLHFALIILRAHWKVEAIFILPLVGCVTFLKKIALVVLLVDTKWTLGDRHVFEGLLEIDHAASNDIVALEEISVVCLQGHSIVLSGVLFFEQETIVETSLTSLATVMAISLKSILRVEIGSEEDIRGTLGVHHLDFLGVPNDKTHFELLHGLLADIPEWLFIFGGYLGRVDLNPTFDDTLRNS